MSSYFKQIFFSALTFDIGHCLFKYLDSHGKSKTPGPEALKSAGNKTSSLHLFHKIVFCILEDIYEICFVSIENFDSGTISNDVEKLRKKEQSGEDNLLQVSTNQPIVMGHHCIAFTV